MFTNPRIIQTAVLLITWLTTTVVSALDLEPKVISSNSLSPGRAVEVAISGNYAYVVLYDSGLQIIDISDGANPRNVGVYNSTGYAIDVTVSGAYAYLATQRRFEGTNHVGGGLEIINVGNPANPQRVGSYSGPGADAVAVAGGFAYLAEEILRVIDISDPSQPEVVGSYPINASAVAISASYAYVLQLNQGLRVLDVSDPADPTLAGSYTTNGYFQDVVVLGNYAYLADSAGLHVVDITQPNAPRLTGKYASYSTDLAISGNYVYMAAQPRFTSTNTFPGGLHIVHVSDPANPRLAGRYDADVSAVAISSHFAYVVDGSSLKCIDVANPTNPTFVGGSFMERDARDVALSGSYAYVADGVAGLEVFDISNPAATQRIGGFYIGTPANSVALAGNHALVAAGSALRIFNVSDPANPEPVARYDSGDEPRNVAVAGSFAYVASSSGTNSAGGGLHVVDISNPANPQRIGRYLNSNAVDVAIAGNYVYLTIEPREGSSNLRGALEIIDISNAANPQRVGQYITAEWAQGIAVAGGYAFIGDGRAGLQIIDVSDPTKPMHAATFRPTSYSVPSIGIGDSVGSLFSSVTIAGNHCYAAEMFFRFGHGSFPLGGSVQILDISQPAQPKRVGSTPAGELDVTRFYQFGSHAQGMALSGNHLFVAGGRAGLQAVEIRQPAPAQVVAHVQPGGYAPAIAVAGNYAYVAEQRRWTGSNSIEGSFRIVDIRANPFVVGGYPAGEATDVAVSGTNAVVLADDWIRVFDVTSPGNPRLVGSYDTDARPAKVAISGNYAYVLSKPFSNGLHVVNFSNPANPQRVGGLDPGGEAFDVAVSGNYVYIAQGPRQTTTNVISGGLQVINVANPASPQRIAAYNTDGSAHGVAVSGQYAFLVGLGIGLHVLDISNPANPQRVGAYAPIDAETVAIFGAYAYVTDTEARLHILDVSDPRNPKRVGGNTSFTGFYDESPTSVAIAGGKLYVGAGDKGLFILHAYQPIRFEQITRAGNGPTQLRVAGPPGVPGHVQRSADLRNWNDWLPVNFAEASIAVIDSDASSPAFYRLVMP